MVLEGELQFLCDVLRKCRVQASALPLDAPIGALVTGLEAVLQGEIPRDTPLRAVLGELAPRTMYKARDDFNFCYIYLRLPDEGTAERVLLVGPYLCAPLRDEQLPEITQRRGLSPKKQRYLREYCADIPVLAGGDRLLLMLDCFCERLWQSPAFSIVEVARQQEQSASPLSKIDRADDFDEILVNMKAMESRYDFERELMQAVALGQVHKAELLLPALSERRFEKRVADPLRNIKNYGIIMNTLLRKAAEEGGVHPVYLDHTSSSFAHAIEQLSSVAAGAELMREMLRSYCHLVRKSRMKDLSRVVRQTVLLIDSDLSADLSLHTLAAAQRVSPGYLSTVFHRETGKTVSEYVREKRVQHAAHLLTTTQLQVQTVALHCGILDVQYFSKIFKQQTGMTPKAYRESGKRLLH